MTWGSASVALRPMGTPKRGLATYLLLPLLLAVGMTACGSSDDVVAPTPDDATTSTTVAETPPDPDYRSWIATVKAEIAEVTLLDAPDGEPLQLDISDTGVPEVVTLPNVNENGVEMTFLVAERFVEANGIAWHEVYLPVRPNEATGFLKAADVELAHTDLAVDISLGSKALTVTNQGEPIGLFPVAIGKADTPTPPGFFYIKELLAPTQPEGTYGPLAYGLSGHSNEVNNEQFPDGVIGIHGTNQPDLIGGEVSNGCVRMTNEDITALSALALPLGTPVTISP